MDQNVVKVTCIDNWSEFGSPKEMFFEHVGRFRNTEVAFTFVENDFRSVDISSLGTNNIYLFDGPHAERDQYDDLALYERALDKDFYFIVDDWSLEKIRSGTRNAIRDLGFKIDYSIEIRTTLDESHAAVHSAASDWHNGYFLSKLSRSRV